MSNHGWTPIDTDELGSMQPRLLAAVNFADQTAEGHSDGSRLNSQAAQMNAKPVRPRLLAADNFAGQMAEGHSDGSRLNSQAAQMNAKPVRPR